MARVEGVLTERERDVARRARNAHAERAVGLFGHAEERTDSQKLREDKVVYEYRADNKI